MPNRRPRRLRHEPPRDPWQYTRTGELQDQLLPRWFLITAGVIVLLGLAVLAIAATAGTRPELQGAARRPPPTARLTHDVGDIHTGRSDPESLDPPCSLLRGLSIAGSPSDQQQLRRGLAGLCDLALPTIAEDAIRAYAERGGTVRFATFEATGVDSVATRAVAQPTIYINTRFTRTNPLWIAPLVAHDAVTLAGDPAAAGSALQARRVEYAVCHRLLGTQAFSRGCQDAGDLLAQPDPIAALRNAGYRSSG